MQMHEEETAQVFPREFDQWIGIVVLGALLAAIVGIPALWFYARSDYVERSRMAPEQPVQFSHRHHVAEVGLDCRYCHSGADRGATAGVPSTAVCVTCHSQIYADSPMLKPIRDSYKTGVAMKWKRVNRVPDYVYFNHSIHVTKGVSCVSCHGRVDQMALVQQAQPLTMGWCLDCHRNPGPNLKPLDKVYDMGYQGKADRVQQEQWIRERHIRSADHLSECNVCHR